VWFVEPARVHLMALGEQPMWPGMTRDQFTAAYAANSGITVDQLHALGRHAEPCDCGDDMCVGWMMAHDDSETPQAQP
jgi:hypothetical protein